MSIQLNHTIVHTRDKQEGAAFLCDILGLPDPVPFGPFLAVRCSNDVTLDFADTLSAPAVQHYAFRVSETEFDAIFNRIQSRGLTYWADPGHQRPAELNTYGGGRGLYWADPTGHNLEILTEPS